MTTSTLQKALTAINGLASEGKVDRWLSFPMTGDEKLAVASALKGTYAKQYEKFGGDSDLIYETKNPHSLARVAVRALFEKPLQDMYDKAREEGPESDAAEALRTAHERLDLYFQLLSLYVYDKHSSKRRIKIMKLNSH